MKRKPIYIIITLLLLAACQTGRRETNWDLLGMIYDHYNNPVQGVELSINGEASVSSDIAGRFLIPNVAAGPHLISLTHADYEYVEVEVQFSDPKQVLYVKLHSLDSLLEKVEEALDGNRDIHAAEFLDRAARIDADNPLLRFYRAILHYRNAETEPALTILRALEEEGFQNSGVRSFILQLTSEETDAQ